MKNIINYVQEEKASFSDKAFREIDSLVLSQLAYLYFDGFVPDLEECAESITLGSIDGKRNKEKLYQNTRDSIKNRKLLQACVSSPRFGDIKINFYVNKLDYIKEKQFSAVTFLLSDDTAYTAFRGTDATFVGWKEDFNMAFSNSIPSQEESVFYLNRVGKLFSGSLKVGGHSKGGNLAVYGAMKCKSYIKNRITDIYSHDGPGFRKEIFDSHEYCQIKNRIRQSIPQSALIGMLLEHHEKYVVVKSRRIGIMQHDPFSWLVNGDDFQYEEQIDNMAVYANRVLQEWLDSLNDENRERFVDTLYSVIKATGAKSFSDLTEEWWEKVPAALDAIRGTDEETKHFVLQTIRTLIIMSVRNLHLELK
ncbi:DUF2974 domain-containing protein [Aminipila sp.]|uniref:DUF2974 domain-containing protein n=1 Tax=Aminipila sp. TaxID=2060095 RepID=UPI0028A0B851|nr:DUF2974 domain-containing protein [Aminipila sp.]